MSIVSLSALQEDDDREAANREFVCSWRDVVIGAKTQQFGKLVNGEIQKPKLPRKFPNLDGFEDMPCVLWLQLQQRPERRPTRRSATRR